MTEPVVMHPRFAELTALLAESRRAVTEAASQAVERGYEVPTHGGRWSAEQVLGHLARVERGVGKLLDREFGAARERGLLAADPAADSILDRLDPRLLADRQRRMAAPEPVRPRAGVSVASALEELAESRAGLLALLAREDGCNLGAVSWPHPILGTLDGYQWVLFVARHEARHAEQLRELADPSRTFQSGERDERG